MKRLVVLLAICAGFGALGVMACGGNDKPPMTPDSENQPPPDSTQADAAAAPTSSATPAK